MDVALNTHHAISCNVRFDIAIANATYSFVRHPLGLIGPHIPCGERNVLCSANARLEIQDASELHFAARLQQLRAYALCSRIGTQRQQTPRVGRIAGIGQVNLHAWSIRTATEPHRHWLFLGSATRRSKLRQLHVLAAPQNHRA